MSYRIVFDKPADRDFRRLPKDVQQALGSQVSALAENPHPADSRKLKGAGNCYRLRHGDYRLIYTILQDHVLILVLRVGHRGDIYRSVPGLAQAIRKHKRQTGKG